MKKPISFSLFAICLAATFSYSQTAPRADQRPAVAREDALDPTPINPAVDPNVDLFINDWRNSQPRAMDGKLIFRGILTRLEGPDPLHPTRKGAVLVNITAISYATLAPSAIASGRAQKGERHVFYTTAGTGQITVNSK